MKEISNQELRDKVSCARLKFEGNSIKFVEYTNSEVDLLKIIGILKKLYDDNDLLEVEKTVEKMAVVTFSAMVNIYSELPIEEYETEMLVTIIAQKKAKADLVKLFSSINEDRKLRTYLRKIENYILKNYTTLDKEAFLKCVDDWEVAEKGATMSSIEIMYEMLTTN